jgi:hypothetical protein
MKNMKELALEIARREGGKPTIIGLIAITLFTSIVLTVVGVAFVFMTTLFR